MHLTTDSRIGGTEKMILAFIKNCSEAFENSVTVMKGNGPLLEEASKHGARCFALNMQSRLDIWKVCALFKILKNWSPDILHSYLFHSNIAGRITGRLAGIRHIICGQRNTDSAKKRHQILFDRWTHPLCEAVISNTQAAKEVITKREKIPPGKIHVIYNGIKEDSAVRSIEKSDITGENDSIILVNVSSFTPKKGHSVLIESVSPILKSRKKIHLVLAGSGPLEDEIRSRVFSLELQKKIHFLGYRNDVQSLLRSCDLFILSSLWEGMPNAVLEAMMQGLPVIASAAGGIPEVIEDTVEGFLVPPGNGAKLADRIIFALDHPEDLKNMALKAKEKVRNHFTIKKMIDSLEGFYRKTVNPTAQKQIL